MRSVLRSVIMILDTTAKRKQIETQISVLQAQAKFLLELEQEAASRPTVGAIPSIDGKVPDAPVRGMSKFVLWAIPADSEISSDALFQAVLNNFPDTSRQAVLVAARRWESRGDVRVLGDKSSGLRFRRVNR